MGFPMGKWLLAGALPRRRAGISLLEISGVLAIGMVVMASVMAMYGLVTTNQNIQATIQEVKDIQALVRNLYAVQTDYTGISAAAVIQSGKLPARMVDQSGQRIMTPMGNVIALTTSSKFGASSFDITIQNVSRSACLALAAAQPGPGTQAVGINGVFTNVGVAWDPSSARQSCKSSNNVAWTAQ